MYRGTQFLASAGPGALPRSIVEASGRRGSKRGPRQLRYSAGGVTGDMEFFLQRTRTFGARCTVDAKVVRLSAKDYQRMLMEAPLVAVMLQHVRITLLICLSLLYVLLIAMFCRLLSRTKCKAMPRTCQ